MVTSPSGVVLCAFWILRIIKWIYPLDMLFEERRVLGYLLALSHLRRIPYWRVLFVQNKQSNHLSLGLRQPWRFLRCPPPSLVATRHETHSPWDRVDLLDPIWFSSDRTSHNSKSGNARRRVRTTARLAKFLKSSHVIPGFCWSFSNFKLSLYSKKYSKKVDCHGGVADCNRRASSWMWQLQRQREGVGNVSTLHRSSCSRTVERSHSDGRYASGPHALLGGFATSLYSKKVDCHGGVADCNRRASSWMQQLQRIVKSSNV